MRQSALAALIPNRQTALLSYLTVPSGVVLFIVRRSTSPGSPHIAALLLPDPGRTLAAQIHRFRGQLANRDLEYQPLARNLYGRLIKPALPELTGVTNLVISPDAALWELPFAALMDANQKHLIETTTLSFTPSLTALSAIRTRPRSPRPAKWRFLALSAGSPNSTLPDAVLEVETIRKNYAPSSALVLTGPQASTAEFLRNAPRAKIIHLASHAALDDRDPLYSFVQLATTAKADEDGRLTARDVLALHLQADLVVLSACETALGRTAEGEGMIGMGWALAAAGASSTVLSYWKVDSAGTRSLMTAFHHELVKPATTRAAALQFAALASRRQERHAHPFYWAAFTLFGNGY